jgi:alpha-galactosidase
MGSHVSAVPNHQTGSITPLKFRFDMAMSGRLGMELQPKDLSSEEKDFARKAIADYKELRSTINYGDLYRLHSPYDEKGYSSSMYVEKDKSRAVIFTFRFKYAGRDADCLLKLNGLDPAKRYRIREINLTDKPVFWGDGKEYLQIIGISKVGMVTVRTLDDVQFLRLDTDGLRKRESLAIEGAIRKGMPRTQGKQHFSLKPLIVHIAANFSITLFGTLFRAQEIIIQMEQVAVIYLRQLRSQRGFAGSTVSINGNDHKILLGYKCIDAFLYNFQTIHRYSPFELLYRNRHRDTTPYGG